MEVGIFAIAAVLLLVCPKRFMWVLTFATFEGTVIALYFEYGDGAAALLGVVVTTIIISIVIYVKLKMGLYND